MEASVVQDHDCAMNGGEFSALIGLGLSRRKPFRTGQVARIREPDREPSLCTWATVA
jgi:hypothetical protein